ncbi:Mu transposase C-terminal domain-containing protein [Rhizobium beringeri]|uniref:Transposase n=1 Tax=Rhizobium leguminosarum TaxID=384 RepID=A0A1B1CNA7_RHILE|nr:Mu transposase C-terminal domain-containing protein [Rhizobium leguminosarum]ANP90000.1 transposase [Rhizobium leguminosarum]ANP90796.1 transposase [Rhizobium leguminosarum]ANP91247.1 transposase [Rhizobium leguminosarum]ANP91721.1 transposase [Rhizobium leguminosarum]API56051.1 transposase [Rhizobium leguminosarum]
MPKPFQDRGPGHDSSDVQWLTARRTARELDRILEAGGSRKDAIARAAAELRLTSRQVYNLLARYRAERKVTALLPRTGSDRRKRLPEAVEEVISATLREQWLTLEAPPLAPVVAEIRARCEEAGHPLPSYVSVARRIPSLFSVEEIAKKRSANPKHVLRLKPRPGYIHAPNPLDVCQIDHTPTDINFVEVVDGAGVFVGRPYLTIVTDVATRAILGFCLTLEKPSVLSVALCLAQAICRKDTWLATRNLNYAWPMFGRPKLLVTDSAKEFKGHAFQRGCDDYGIRIRYRDRGRVHQGGVVERLLGKLNGVLGTYPGSSGRSVADRDEYPSERRACLSFADLERCVALAIIDHNLQENPKTLKVPIIEWQRDNMALPDCNDEPQQVLLSFLPGTERQLSAQGISMFALHYYSPWLGSLVPERDRLGKLEVRYDPRDISHVYVRDPETRLFRPVERRDGHFVPLTLWEHDAERGRRRAINLRSSVDKVAFRREIAAIAAAAKPSKRELRDAVRRAHAAAAQKPYAATEAQAPDHKAHPMRQKNRLPVEDW